MTVTEILFRADATPSMGGGHLMRCLALAEALHDRGAFCRVACAAILPAIERRFQRSGIPVHRIGTEVAPLSALAASTGARAIVVDGYQFDEPWRLALRSAGLPILAFSDVTPPLPLHADIAVDAAADPGDITNRDRETVWLLGPDYVLLRRDLVIAARLPPLPITARRSILVTFGSSDPAGLTLPVTSGLAQCLGPDVPLDVVIGGGVPEGERLAGQVSQIGHQARVHHDPPALGDLMRGAGLAVSAAGGTIGELAALGVPTIAAIVAANQDHTAKSTGAWWDAVDMRLSGSLGRLIAQTAVAWRDPEGRQRRANQVRAAVDPEGASRVAAALLARIG